MDNAAKDEPNSQTAEGIGTTVIEKLSSRDVSFPLILSPCISIDMTFESAVSKSVVVAATNPPETLPALSSAAANQPGPAFSETS